MSEFVVKWGAKVPGAVIGLQVSDLNRDKSFEIIAATNERVYLFGSANDTDSDGWTDYAEGLMGTERNRSDSDNDGLADPLDPHPLKDEGYFTDSDKDNLSDAAEKALGMDPFDLDSDHDGLSDDTDPHPLIPEDQLADSDGDGLADYEEIARGTDPAKNDTDGDGIIDSKDAHPLKRDAKQNASITQEPGKEDKDLTATYVLAAVAFASIVALSLQVRKVVAEHEAESGSEK